MKNIKWIALSIVLLLFLANPILASASNTFVDIKKTDESYKEIHYIANLGIISGYTENGQKLYKPQNNITRAQASKMLVIATKNQGHDGSHIKLNDVESGSEQDRYISKAVSLGYFKLKSDGTFKPNEFVQRTELAAALATAFKFSEPITLSKPLHFNDVKKDDVNAAHINALYYAGVSRGDKNAFGPNKLLTRKQFALFVARAIDNQFKLSVSNPNPSLIGNGKSKVNNLNVRTSPSTNNGIIVGQLNKGDTFDVISVQGNWVEIKYYNRPAFISKSKEYVDFLDSDSKPVGVSTHFVKINVKDSTLNVRTLPSVNGNVIGTLKNGEIVEVHGEKNGWSLITINDIPGYVNSSYTVKVDNPDNNTATGNLIGKVTVSSLNVRSGTGTNFPVISSLKRGQKVEVTALNGYWATIKVNGQTGYVHKSYLKLLNQSSARLKDRIIVIDAGHGGSDPGATKNGLTEKSINLKVSQRVETKLKRAGAKVLMTRTGDTFPSLTARADYAKKNFAEAFVSIHVNAAGATSASGAEVFYDTSTNPNGDESKTLAQYIQNNIVKQAKMRDRGVKDARFVVIRENNVAAVLVELGFITNSADFQKLSSDAYLEIYAEAIYQGILQYYSVD